jgi:hypothetical protein|uniref:hypothetical protein n=1 Tax=Aliarcobacter sp. TaxID=2321116 RepID=UPI0040479A42
MAIKRIIRKEDEELDKIFFFLSKRNDDIYTDIENFQQHEYTTGIIYEMFIRTNKNIQRQYNFEDDKVQIMPQRVSDIVLFVEEGIFTLQNIIYELFPQLENDIKEFLSNHYKIPLENDDEINNLFLNYSVDLKYFISNYIEKYKKQQDNDINKVIFKEVEYFNKSKKMKIKIDIDELERIISNSNIVTTVIPYYKRPQVFLKENYLVNINYLNLALPEEELFDLIKQLKKEVKKETTFINKFIKDSKFSNYLFIDEKTETKNNHKYTIFGYKHSSKMADIFFVYDAFKNNKDNGDNLVPYDDLIQYIQKEIYYSKNEAPSKYLSESTINNYYETAEYYIDKKHYLTLLGNL